MSGHSKWAKTHRQKEATDAKRGAIFTKMGHLISIAAKEGGDDLESNFKLRLAIDKAKAVNMPKDNITRAIKRGAGTGKDGAILEEITYEAFGPTNSTFLIETITDNKNRTISDIKIALTKNGGQLGGSGSVAWQFERKGIIILDAAQLRDRDIDELELNLIDAGAEDIKKDEDEWVVITTPDNLQETEKNLINLKLKTKESSLGYVPKDALNIENSEAIEKIGKLYSALDDIDDVSNIYTNAD